MEIVTRPDTFIQAAQELAAAAKAGAAKWSLEDDDDEDEGNDKADKVEESEEEDPLDAYMNQVSKEVKKLRGPRAAPPVKKDTKETAEIKAAAADAASTVKKMVTIMTGVAKKTTGGAEKRGELIEQNPGRATNSFFSFAKRR